MKKLLCMAFIVACMGFQVAAQSPTPTPLCRCTGDVNFDFLLSFGDAQIAFMIALGVYSPTDEEFCAADCNCDGNVTAGDA